MILLLCVLIFPSDRGKMVANVYAELSVDTNLHFVNAKQMKLILTVIQDGQNLAKLSSH